MNLELPKLDNWNSTRDSLKKVSHIIKEIRKTLIESQPISLEHSVNIYPKGIFADLGNIGNLYYNYAKGQLTLKKSNKLVFSFSIENKSSDFIIDSLENSFNDIGTTLKLDRSSISGSEPHSIENTLAKDYSKVVWKLYSALARVKAQLFGVMSPIVLWTHHFDFAFLYFTTDKRTESDPSIALGFAPYSDGIERPYLYMYAWDGKAYVSVEENNLPKLSKWWDKGWKGAILMYDDLIGLDNPIKIIEDFYLQLYVEFHKV